MVTIQAIQLQAQEEMANVEAEARERDHHVGNEGENVKAGQYGSGSYNGEEMSLLYQSRTSPISKDSKSILFSILTCIHKDWAWWICLQ